MLLVIAIVGTTVAPWQLFFQQSYVVDKRITPRFIRYGRLDLWIGIGLVMIGAVAMMAFCAAIYTGQPEFGNFADAGAISVGLEKYVGKFPAILFALALLDACIIGACAVSLSTAYAVSDVLSLRHSLHRKPTDAKGFYIFYCGLIALSAALVLTPGTPLGLLTNAVQTLAMDETYIVGILVGGTMLGLVMAAIGWLVQRGRGEAAEGPIDRSQKISWRMPPLSELTPARLTTLNQTWMIVLRGYLAIAGGLVLVRIVQLAAGGDAS